MDGADTVVDHSPANHAVDERRTPGFDHEVARDQAVMVQADARRHGHVAHRHAVQGRVPIKRERALNLAVDLIQAPLPQTR